ncbi:MAG: hypothetical protein KGY99_03635 [Phycisphaerae bacterium]|jgi:hypothetical protein|nr:hypothetical protein [Phycisphaerae bacterium]
MAKGSAIILVALGVAVAGVCWAVTHGPSRPALSPDGRATTDPLHDALDDLAGGDFRAAERAGEAIASHGVMPRPRAWLIVAASRYRQQRYGAAIEAYRNYLSGCDSPTMRRYVTQRINDCRAASAPAPHRVPSEQLSPERLAALAEVDDVVHAESTDHFVIRSRNYDLSKLLGAEAEAALRRICQDLLDGRAFPHSVDIYVWRDRREYLNNASALAPEWSDGSFSVMHDDGLVTWRIDLTQLDADGGFSTRMLDRVLPHELCHLVLKDLFGDAPCPLAVNEGVAMLAEARCDPQRLVLAGAAVAGRRGIPLAKLLILPAEQVDGNEDLFYAEALSFLEFLRGRMTGGEFRGFLEHIKSGSTVPEAVERAMGIPADNDAPLMPALTTAWEDYAIAQSQMLRALER